MPVSTTLDEPALKLLLEERWALRQEVESLEQWAERPPAYDAKAKRLAQVEADLAGGAISGDAIRPRVAERARATAEAIQALGVEAARNAAFADTYARVDASGVELMAALALKDLEKMLAQWSARAVKLGLIQRGAGWG